MSARVTVNQGVLDRILRRRGGAAERRLQARVDEVRARYLATTNFKPADVVAFVEPGSRGLTGVVRNNHFAGKWHELGTRPHRIVARNAKALKFRPTGQSGYIFRKAVNHPGQRASHALRDALQSVR